jgi:hypothetical protein
MLYTYMYTYVVPVVVYKNVPNESLITFIIIMNVQSTNVPQYHVLIMYAGVLHTLQDTYSCTPQQLFASFLRFPLDRCAPTIPVRLISQCGTHIPDYMCTG